MNYKVIFFSIVFFISLMDSALAQQESTLNHQPFDIEKDLLLLQYDCKTDVDDLHSIAAFATLLTKPKYAKLNYHVVAGTYGMQNGLYVSPNTLIDITTFGEHWSDAHKSYEKAIQAVIDLSIKAIQQNGTIWIAEAGQSDFSADMVKGLKKQLPELDKNSIQIVQHSNWNEEVTTPEKLEFVKTHTSYHKIPDGNALDNGTPGLRSETPIDWESKIMNQQIATVWEVAIQLADEYNGKQNRYLNQAIQKGGMDFSDFSEVCWILGLNEIADAKGFFEFIASDN